MKKLLLLVLIAALGWPWIFFVNVPVSVAVVAIGMRQIEAGGGLRLPGRGWAAESGLLAVAGVVLLGALSQAPVHGLVHHCVGLTRTSRCRCAPSASTTTA